MKSTNIIKVMNSNSNGFTLIELIVVVILISIMAVTVLPKFFGSNGYEEYTYRDELITKLRAIQLRAMQQTNGNTCQEIKVEASEIGLLATNGVVCDTGKAGDSTTVTITNDHNVSFSISESLTSFSFSSLGKPVGCTPVDNCEITITITGESTLEVDINKEGYIYAP